MMQEISETAKRPKYWKKFYGWLYGDKFWTRLFNQNYFLYFLTLGNSHKLAHQTVKEIKKNDKVLQLGITFGSLIDMIATKVGQYGHYDIVDVSSTQISVCKNKYKLLYPWMNFMRKDAAGNLNKSGFGYDVVICYMLLHEVPPRTKAKIIENAIKLIKENGKVIFVDYHNPVKWHPLRYVVRMFNRLFQPFAEKLWDLEISHYCKNPAKYKWKKTFFFGQMYQKIVVSKRAPDILEN